MTAMGIGAGLLLGLGLVLLYHLHYRRQLALLSQVLQQRQSPRILGLTSPLFSLLLRHQERQERLQNVLTDFQALLDHLPLAYLEVDADNQLQQYNAAAQALLKWPDSDRGRYRLLLELFRSYDLDQLIEATRQTQVPCQREWSLNLVGTDLANPQPQPNLYLRGHGFPLTQGRVGVFLEDRREAVQLTQQRDRWVSDVAHELKTPLTSIRLVAETLVNRVAPPWQSWMERLLGEVIHLSHLVQDLLDLSRLDRRSPHLVLSSLDLVDLVNTAWDSLEPISRRRQIDLHYHGPTALFLEGDRSRLYQVLLNLLDNAIKYSPTQSVITVRLSTPTADQICLEVMDQGSGFPPEALPHIFERFYRADPARTRSPIVPPIPLAADPTPPDPGSPSAPPPLSQVLHSGSCGLGLSIVQQIVLAHQGRVSAQNHPQGGAWLTLHLPRSPQGTPPKPNRSPDSAG